MIYTLIVCSNHLTQGRNALQLAEELVASGGTISLIYFLFDGVYVANRFIDIPTDEFNLNDAWRDFAQQHQVKLSVCMASGLRRGISKHSIANGFDFASIGELVESCQKSDEVITA